MHRIDRRRVRDSFGKRAPEYEDHALVQKRVVARFLEKLENDRLAPHSFLDVGTGSGMLLRVPSGSLQRHLCRRCGPVSGNEPCRQAKCFDGSPRY